MTPPISITGLIPDALKELLLKALVPIMLDFIKKLLTENLTVEVFQKRMDQMFDWVEDFVKDTTTLWDDTLVLPVITEVREILNVPDNDPVVISDALDKLKRALELPEPEPT